MTSPVDDGDLRAAVEEARSPSWSVRVSAGRRLASRADISSAAGVLEELLLDPEDTAVTRETAVSLLAQGTTAAVRLVAVAVAHADDNHGDWLQTAVHDVLCLGEESGSRLPVVCRALRDDPEPAVRRGAVEILQWLEDCSRGSATGWSGRS